MMIMLITTLIITMYLMKKSPISMLMALLIYCITITNIMLEHMTTKWMVYLIILMITGGMLVIFLYTTSMIPNTSNTENSLPNFYIMSFIILMTMIIDINKPNYNLSKMNQIINTPQIMLIEFPTLTPTIMAISYLLITLLISIKIIKTSMKSMRQF